MEWLVYLADGTTRNSTDHQWDEVPDGVLVVRVWDGPRGDLVDWGNSYYGRPDTLKMEARVSDATFAQVLALAQAEDRRPSARADRSAPWQ